MSSALSNHSKPVIFLAFANEQEGRRYLRNLPAELGELQEILEVASEGEIVRLRFQGVDQVAIGEGGSNHNPAPSGSEGQDWLDKIPPVLAEPM